MLKDVIDGSRDKTYIAQQKLVADIVGSAYEVPKALDAVVCMFMYYAATDEKKRLFSDEPWTYTRCAEATKWGQVVVGGFAQGGLSVTRNCNFGDDVSVGVAALREF